MFFNLSIKFLLLMQEQICSYVIKILTSNPLNAGLWENEMKNNIGK